jgi:hypothetical protein
MQAKEICPGRMAGQKILYSFLGCLQGSCQLIGAGGGLQTAGSALQTGNNGIHVHSFYKAANALKIAVATADEIHVLDFAIFDIEEDALGASALGFVFKLHMKNPFYLVCFIIAKVWKECK